MTDSSVTFGMAKYEVTTGEIRQTSPTVATITSKDGLPETIVVFGDESGLVHVINAATCQELPGWPQAMQAPPGRHAVIESTPAIGWLDGPSRPPTIVVGSGSTWVHTAVGEVEAFNLDGAERWERRVQATPGNANGVFSSPAIGDVGGGGQEDVVFGSWDYHLYVLNSDGKNLPGTPYYNAETIWSSPALFQLPGQSADDIFIGNDKTQTRRRHGCVGGYISDFRYGMVPDSSHRGLYVVHQVCQGEGPLDKQGQSVWSSPAVGYLTPPSSLSTAGVGAADREPHAAILNTDPVVAVGTSWYETPFGTGTSDLYVYDAATLKQLWRGVTAGPVFGSPAIGDVVPLPVTATPRSDLVDAARATPGDPAIVDTSFICTPPVAIDSLQDCLGSRSDVEAWSAAGKLLWQQTLLGPADLGSPILVPLEGETANDVLVGSGDGLYPLDGATGAFLYGTSTARAEQSVHSGCRLFNTPAVADVQGAGPYGGWYAFELCSDGAASTGGLYAFELPKAPAAAPGWPMFRADPEHDGVAHSTLPGTLQAIPGITPLTGPS